MKVNFDISVLNTHVPTGVGVYTFELIKALSNIEKIQISGSYKISNVKRLKTIRSNISIPFTAPYVPALYDFFPHNFDVFHGPNFWTPPTKGIKTVVTVHDLAHFNPNYSTNERCQRASFLFDRLVNEYKPDRIITVSDFVRNELLNRYPHLEKDTYTVYHGADHLMEKSSSTPYFNFPYLLYLGTLEHRKNIKGLFDAYETIKSKIKGVKLVLVGNPSGHGGEEIVRYIKENDNSNNVVITGYLDNSSVKSILKNAVCSIYPSLYEGFGIPILEAMQFDIPVITSSFGAMQEVAGDAALLVDTRNKEEFSNAILNIVYNGSLRNQLITLGRKRSASFTWKKTAENSLKVYESIE
jgi:glycosyltransferase involved in cell wall biosynthesis